MWLSISAGCCTGNEAVEGATIIFILYGGFLLAVGGYWLRFEISYRWQVWQPERLTACQRRVLHQQEPRPGFEVVASKSEQGHGDSELQRAA